MATAAGMVVAGIQDQCVSSTIKLVSSTIHSLVIGPVTRLNVKKETRRLSTEILPAIKCIINLVESALLREMETTAASERAIQESLLLSLKDLAYDIQDIVDEVSTETARHPLPNATSWRNLNFWVDLVCGCFAPSCLGYSADMHMLERCPLKFYVHLAYKIDAVYSQLENIKSENKDLFVDSSARVNNDQTYERKHRLTTEFLHKNFKPVGRDEEKANIIGRLMDPESEMLVIPIVGMGGLGKTTLAKVVLDDECIKQHFNFRKWVFVGTNFDIKLVLKKLIPDDQISDDDFEERVIKEFKEKTFLIVLDDVWDQDRKNLEKLLKPLSHGGAGSRTIITTREERLARFAGSNGAYQSLTALSHDYSVDLFEKHAFPGGCLDKHSNLREIGKQIVDRLGGLPLALEVVGSALSGDRDESSWMSISNKNNNGIMPALVWSYERLPYHLKQCFRYCSLFSRKDASQSKTVLIYLWIANGYIEPEEERSLEEIGNDYMKYLISASFFQETSNEDFPYDIIKMHDLIYDLAVVVSKGEIVKIDKNTDSANINPLKIRHLAIYDGQRCPNTIKWDRLHTVAIMDRQSKILGNISQLRSIRVLTGVSGEEIQCLTRNPMHLRYLSIDSMDESMEPWNRSHNLQSLLVRHINFAEVYMFQSLSKLTNLRFLQLPHLWKPIGVEGVGNLTSLRYLQVHVIHDRDGCRIGELKKLSKLHGMLVIYNLENVQDGEATEAKLHEKTHLKELALIWNTEFDDETNTAPHCNNHESVLEGLRPHPNLKKLSLYGFGGSFCRPNWIGEQLRGMVEIELQYCNNLVELPPLGQLPRLKKLEFSNLERLQRVTAQFYGNVSSSGGVVFPSLESLVFNDIPKWQEWQGVQGNNLKWFPCLQELVIRRCTELRELPHLPSSTRTLTIRCAKIQKLPNFWGCNGKTQHSQEIPSFLTSLEIEDCPELESSRDACVLQHPSATNSLATIMINLCPNLMHVASRSLDSMSSQLEVNSLHTDCRHLLKACDPTKLKELHVDVSFNVSESTCFTYEEMQWWQSLASLEKLTLLNADDLLVSSWVSNFFRNTISLKELQLIRCSETRSLPEKELPQSLRQLTISQCEHLRQLYLDEGPGREVLLDLVPGLKVFDGDELYVLDD